MSFGASKGTTSLPELELIQTVCSKPLKASESLKLLDRILGKLLISKGIQEAENTHHAKALGLACSRHLRPGKASACPNDRADSFKFSDRFSKEIVFRCFLMVSLFFVALGAYSDMSCD